MSEELGFGLLPGTSEGQGNQGWSTGGEAPEAARLASALVNVARTVCDQQDVTPPLKRELSRLADALERAPIPDAHEVASVDTALRELSEPPAEQPRHEPEMARIIATELAISGASRAVVRQHLRAIVPRDEANAVVAAVMGNDRGRAVAGR